MSPLDKVIVVGVDPSSVKIAVVWTVGTNTTEPRVWMYKLPSGQDYAARCGAAYKAMRHLLRAIATDYPDHSIYFFIEDAVVGRGGARSTIAQSKIHGALMAAADLNPNVVYATAAHNGTIKKQAVGSGNASKPEIRTWVRLYWRNLEALVIKHNKGDQQDMADAGMINRYGWGVVQTKFRLDTYRKKAPIKKKRVRRT